MSFYFLLPPWLKELFFFCGKSEKITLSHINIITLLLFCKCKQKQHGNKLKILYIINFIITVWRHICLYMKRRGPFSLAPSSFVPAHKYFMTQSQYCFYDFLCIFVGLCFLNTPISKLFGRTLSKILAKKL